jgi:hypothetical protein
MNGEIIILETPQKLKEQIQKLMVDVTGDSYKDIRSKSAKLCYVEQRQAGNIGYRLDLSVEANGSDINVSLDNFVSTIKEYLYLDQEPPFMQESHDGQMFREGHQPYKQNVKHEVQGKTMYCAVSISVERNQ